MCPQRETALFVSDLHGSRARYDKLFEAIASERPTLVLIGGDLLPSGLLSAMTGDSFVQAVLAPGLEQLRNDLGQVFPPVVAIPGNDDGRAEEQELLRADREGLLHYLPGKNRRFGRWAVFGYPYIPPSPFRMKDWERYDVSRYVDPGCTPPEGDSSFASELRQPTIAEELNEWIGDQDVSRAVFLFHAPPYDTVLDRAALDGKSIDHCPLDVHIGSIAIRRFIEDRQPWLTLHGHVHESARLTGQWRQQLGDTWALSAAHDGPELALVQIPLDEPGEATRTLVAVR